MRTRMQNIFIIVMVFCAAIPVAAQTLDDYIRIAAENNPELKAAFNQYLAALERVPQATALPDPTAMFRSFIIPGETGGSTQPMGLAVAQEFPWPGQLSAQGSAAEELAKARFSEFEEIRNKLVYEVKSTFYEYYVLEAAIRITQDNIKLVQTFKELANIKLESALGSAVDLLRAEMELQELNNDVLFLNDSRLPVETQFKKLLNTDTLPAFQVPDTLRTQPLTVTQKVLLDSILANNPTLAKYGYEISSLEQEISVAEKMGLPSFNLGVAITSLANPPGMVMPEIGVRIPIWRSKYNAMVKERQIMQSSVAEEKKNRINELNAMMEATWRDYANAERRVRLFNRLSSLATQALDIIVSKYTAAGIEFEEILRMNRQLLRYELELERARADQNTTISYLNYLTGRQL